MNYRFIEGEELSKISEILYKQGWLGLDHKFSKALVCEEDGEIVGFLVLRAIIHAEPLFVKKEYRGKKKGIAKALAKKTADYLEENGINYLCAPENPFAVELCEENGMTRLEAPLYRKQNFIDKID